MTPTRELEAYAMLSTFVAKLGLSYSDTVVQKAMHMIRKGITMVHVLAGVLLYNYFKSIGYQYVSIEETVGSTKCDVYARLNSVDVCIEVETYVIPYEHILDGYQYIFARHVKKVLQVLREGIASISFAYPFGLIPLVPPVLLKPPEDRSRDELEGLLAISRRFYGIDWDAVDILKRCVIEGVYVYNIVTQAVSYIPGRHALELLSTYIKTLGMTGISTLSQLGN